ncbi:hypothetical protein [Lutimonas zeaxanthinifaciens]|uniref:hypothetical protein n=1 Tax=Lutimonas zeaxanthinifaciens TaxID=3060215 RepID=UPI00265CC89E|nr:hypothetical protein [Lutimonas sp. YSD2104]WKK66512.1 hypothetical protein QZH61_02560 [Lutimonas sp. YSD2104]
MPELLITRLRQRLIDKPPYFKYRKEVFYYIVHQLIIIEQIRKKEEYHVLNKSKLRDVTICDPYKYIKYLENGEFIISDNKHQRGKKSKWYKINEKLKQGVIKVVLEPTSKLYKAIIKFQRKRRAHFNRLAPHLKLMKDKFMGMELDYSRAYKWAERCPETAKRYSYITTINNIEDKRFRYFKRNKTNNRLDTNLTNLKSDLRQYMIGDFVSIDVRNSQPFLLAILLQSILYPKGTLCWYLQEGNLAKTFGIRVIERIVLVHQKQEKAEMVNFRSFQDSVVQGQLYDNFIELHSGNIERCQAKEIMFEVLFSQNTIYKHGGKFIPYKEDKRIFARSYPFVAQAVKDLKSKNHKILPIYLQQLESYLFIDRIAKELVENGVIPFTIHDSVIVNASDQEKTLGIMTKLFKEELGLVPALDIKKM